MNLIELLEELDRIGATMVATEEKLTVHAYIELPRSLATCIKRHKQALMDRCHARRSVRVPKLTLILPEASHD